MYLNHVYVHVSLHTGHTVDLSQLHRLATRITDRDINVLDCARLLTHFTLLGYNLPLLFCKLRHHLIAYHHQFGDTSWRLRGMVLLAFVWPACILYMSTAMLLGSLLLSYMLPFC